METLQLVENIRQGRDVRAAEEELYARIEENVLPRLMGRVPDQLRSRVDPQDVLHDAFLRALGSLDSFQPSSEPAFFAWVFAIAKNLLRDSGKRRSVGAAHFVRSEEGGGPRATLVAGTERRPESLLAERDRIEKVLRQLDPKEAEIIRLHKLEGLDFPQLAERLKKSEAAVRRAYSRAAQRFRALVDESDFESRI